MNSPIIQIDSNHIAYVLWFEGMTGGTNWLKVRSLSNHGRDHGEVQTICALRTTNWINGNLELKRTNTAGDSDTFRAWPFPVPAVNPAQSNHLYVAFADRGTNAADKADIFLTYSVDGGTNWTVPTPVNTVWTNDQWMPVLAVKPDGTQLFMAWYDRRNDPNNGLMEVFGRWATLETNGSVSLGDEFRITSVSYPHVFSGTDTNNFVIGRYDPVYPPTDEPNTNGVNLHWWYPEWPEDPFEIAIGTHKNHVGEYNGLAVDASGLFFSWTDNRVWSGREWLRAQSDIRHIRLTWP